MKKNLRMSDEIHIFATEIKNAKAMNKEKNIAMYNKLVNFLFEINNRFVEENYPKELREFIKAGNKLRDAIDKNTK